MFSPLAARFLQIAQGDDGVFDPFPLLRAQGRRSASMNKYMGRLARRLAARAQPRPHHESVARVLETSLRANRQLRITLTEEFRARLEPRWRSFLSPFRGLAHSHRTGWLRGMVRLRGFGAA
jgi:hypothetical protein